MIVRTSILHRNVFFFLVFFIVFDGMRSNLIISAFISPFREVALNLFIALSIPIFRYCKKETLYLVIPFLFVSIFTIINIPITFLNNISLYYNSTSLRIFENKYSSLYKHIIFPILLLSMISYTKKYTLTVKKGMNYFINLAAIYSVITIPVYLYGFPLFKAEFRDWGRMGVGYPTMDGQMLCFAIFSLIFLVKQKNTLHFNIKMACLLLGIMAQNTGTAMVSIFFIFIVCIFKKPVKTISYALFSIPIIIAIAIQQYYSNPYFFTEMLFITNNKIDALLHPNTVKSGLDTLAMRAVQYDMLIKIRMSDWILYLFGLGGQAYMENEFKLTLSAYGIFSSFFFGLSFLWIAVSVFIKKNKNSFLIIIVLTLWAFTSYTLSSIQLFTTSFCFSMVFSYTYITGLRGANYSYSAKEDSEENTIKKTSEF